ncbi:MAG: winged helix-turn-helix transcriptional regulator [Bacilli bacterium]|jgi:DNA-binding HxlR family transcriptional regulator|nr:winged helix-turn-helix transcriptional regulator [Bacilli bacterium]
MREKVELIDFLAPYLTRYTAFIIVCIGLNINTFTKLLESIDGLQRSILSNNLKLLEAEDLITHDKLGRSKKYSLTSKGNKLNKLYINFALGVTNIFKDKNIEMFGVSMSNTNKMKLAMELKNKFKI